MSRYFLEFCFKGTNYSGWQVQKNAVSVQEKVDNALTILSGTKTQSTGCGRTDTGVHAKQFFAHFDCEKKIADKKQFVYQLNAILPNDISAFELHEVDDDASARFDAIKRTYEYYLYRSKNPFLKEFATTMLFDVDVEKINKACSVLLAHDDFKCFSKSRTQVKHTICNIYEAKWEEKVGKHKFTITANRFLRGMVRAIVGTLQRVGKEELSLNDFKKIIENKQRSAAGASVDACGLYLSRIEYPYLSVKRKFEFPFEIK